MTLELVKQPFAFSLFRHRAPIFRLPQFARLSRRLQLLASLRAAYLGVTEPLLRVRYPQFRLGGQ